jgi:endonuclease YncB( thermonuclease family)
VLRAFLLAVCLLLLIAMGGLAVLAVKPDAVATARRLANEILTARLDRLAEPDTPAGRAQSEGEAGLGPASGEIVPPAVRDVTPKGVTAGPQVTGPLVRIAPPPALPKPQEKPRARVERLFKPVVAEAGRIETARGAVVLPGVAAPGPEETCGAPAWPCGRMARAALRRFIRGRAIDCDIPPAGRTLADAVRCTVGGEDVAEWLVRQGWAKADGDAYAGAAAEARSERRGIWGDGRPQ